MMPQPTAAHDGCHRSVRLGLHQNPGARRAPNQWVGRRRGGPANSRQEIRMASMSNLSIVRAVVREILPRTGLAYLDGEDQREWTVTKSTPGADFAHLSPGDRVELSVERHDAWLIVSGYSELDH
ncbi:MAG: hypothetical protein QM702_22705 [Rubrivivax sp.]